MSAASAKQGFHWVDYVIFVAMLVVSISIGLYHALNGGRQRTTREFLLADRRLGTIPAALSILVSFVSAILVLGTAAEVYTRGVQLILKTVGYCIACAISSVLFVPLFFNLKVNSSFEYLEHRFHSRLVRLLGTISMIVSSVFYMSLVIYTPATAIEASTGFPLWWSILGCGLVATVYTTMGGMRAVVWTDVLQAVVMMLGLVLIVIVGTLRVGGFVHIWRICGEDGRLEFINLNPDPVQRLSFWSLVIGGSFNTLTVFGIGQSTIQRYCSLASLKEARRSLFLNIPGLLLINLMVGLVGLVVYAYYANIGCDPLREGYISNANQLVPYFMTDVLNYPGLPGIFLAVLFGGALSSLSSSLNSVATVTWEDLLKPMFASFTEKSKASVTKLIVFSYGILAIVLSFLAQKLGGHVLQLSLSFTGATSGPSLGMFLLGALFSSSNKQGAIAGFVVSMSFSLWILIGAFIVRPYEATLPTTTTNCLNGTLLGAFNDTQLDGAAYTTEHNAHHTSRSSLQGLNRLYGISFLWYSTIGALTTIIVGLIVSNIISSLTGSHNEKLDPNLLIPVRKRLVCCLPTRWQCCLHLEDKPRATSQETKELNANDAKPQKFFLQEDSSGDLLDPNVQQHKRIH